MNRRALGILLVLAGAPHAGALAAQEAAIAPGTDVRLVVAPGRDLRGHFISWDADTIRIRASATDSVSAVPAIELERLRVSEPRTRGRGALRGLGAGSFVGALALGTLFVASETDCDWCFGSVGEAFMVGAAIGAGLGGGVGAAVGAAWPGTRWVDVDPHARNVGPTLETVSSTREGDR